MQRVQYVQIIPGRHTVRLMTRRRVGVKRSAASEGSPDRSLRVLQWLVAGLAFLALFLISFRAKGWM